MNRLILDLTIAFGLYIIWFIIIIYGNAMPLWLLFIIGGYVVCLHGSLQHIAVHGYPFRRRWLNTILVYPPLAFYYPYQTYRETHITHHKIERLTDVASDPESVYLPKAHWESLSRLSQIIYRFNFTLLGRMVIGPLVSLYLLWKGEAAKIMAGDRRCGGIWVSHIAACSVIALFIHFVSEMPLWKYLLCFVYPGISLTLLRSYTEHRWSNDENQRSIIVEGSFVSQLLYLNNNFHWVHHENPALPWQDISKVFKQRRAEILNNNGNFYYQGYLQLFAHLFKDRWIDPIHPLEAN